MVQQFERQNGAMPFAYETGTKGENCVGEDQRACRGHRYCVNKDTNGGTPIKRSPKVSQNACHATQNFLHLMLGKGLEIPLLSRISQILFSYNRETWKKYNKLDNLIIEHSGSILYVNLALLHVCVLKLENEWIFQIKIFQSNVFLLIFFKSLKGKRNMLCPIRTWSNNGNQLKISFENGTDHF